MAKRDAFSAKGLRIETWRDFDARVYCCWRPNISILCRTRKEVLKFAAWPAKTPTGDALRAALDQWEAIDLERREKTLEPVGDANVEGSWDPQAHGLDESDPQFQTRIIT